MQTLNTANCRDAFNIYAKSSLRTFVEPRKLKYAKLDDKYKRMIDGFWNEHLDKLGECIAQNDFFLQGVVRAALQVFGDERSADPATWAEASHNDMDKVLSTLRQVAREWSTDGAAERDASYGRIVRELEALYPDRGERHGIKVLVPGCGLARLPFDLCAAGFQAQGNEFSYHMLFTSAFILNFTEARNEYRIHPYVHRFSHNRTREDQLHEVLVPDVHPGLLSQHAAMDPGIPNEGLMSMRAGSFDEIYPPPDGSLFDAVATTFFIDTAPNLFDTLATIHASLKPGGLWLNFGPLLWHYESSADQAVVDERSGGLEFALDDVLHLVQQFGFEFVKRESDIAVGYTGSPRSMGDFQYRCEYWVVRKA